MTNDSFDQIPEHLSDKDEYEQFEKEQLYWVIKDGNDDIVYVAVNSYTKEEAFDEFHSSSIVHMSEHICQLKKQGYIVVQISIIEI